MEKQKIKYSDLSGWLKFAIVISYIIGGVWIISFIVGMIEGLVTMA